MYTEYWTERLAADKQQTHQHSDPENVIITASHIRF